MYDIIKHSRIKLVDADNMWSRAALQVLISEDFIKSCRDDKYIMNKIVEHMNDG